MSDEERVTIWLQAQPLPASLAQLRERLLFAFPQPALANAEQEAHRLIALLDEVVRKLCATDELEVRGDRFLPFTMIICRQQRR